MTSKDQTQADMYFFWLYDWGETTLDVLTRPFTPRYTFCRIDREELYLQDAHLRFTIPLTSIKQWNTLVWSSVGAKVSSNVEIVLFSRTEVLPELKIGPRLFLLPMNVFRYDGSYAEAKALVRVLDHFKAGASLQLDPNPYVRNWKPKRGNAPPAGGWDPVQPPYVYTESPNTWSRCLLVLAVFVGVSAILIPVLGLLANTLLGR